MTQLLTHGCKARSPYFPNNEVTFVAEHPNKPGKFIVGISCEYAIEGETVYVVNAEGYDSVNDHLAQAVDAAREAWDKLDSGVQEALSYTACGRKITAIKALRALTGLGLADAKRAIEVFA